MDQTSFYLMLSAMLFSVGTLGVLMRKNAIVIFMCIELMLNAVNITLVALSNQLGLLEGQLYVIFVMAVAAAEAAVGLAIILLIFKNYHSIEVRDADTLSG